MNQQQSALTIAGSVLLGAIIIAVAIITAGGGRYQALTIPAGAQPAATAQAAQQPVVDIKNVKISGEPSIGSATAPVTIAYWFDYQCPFCKQNEETVMPDIIKDYVDTGKVRIVYKDFPFLGPDSETLAIAARAVWDAAPDKFYAWHKAMFDDQGRENSGWATSAEIQKVTESALGVPVAQLVMQLMSTDKSKYETAISADLSEGQSFGITGTPSMIIGGPGGSKLDVGTYPYNAIQSDINSALGSR
ncbi:MAG: thioredoxin domain-containing protein [Patescibacteria group bacterium]|nr:thioredoxin domain-containing protein [Patescibacteria group bacterium]